LSPRRTGFTLIELLVVVAIMGLLGTVSVGGYRAMQRGMEERGVMQNVNQFVRTAYQRAQIDRQPVAVYFWNEMMREETDMAPPVIVGKAVAVRRAGRLTAVVNDRWLYDEFGDLRFNRLLVDASSDEEETDETSLKNNTVYLYPVNGEKDGTDVTRRSEISAHTARRVRSEPLLLADNYDSAEIESYAFYVINANGVKWRVGDAYGFEFETLQLPHNYVFGANVPTSIGNPVVPIDKALFTVGNFSQSGVTGGGDDFTIAVASLRPDKSGELAAQKIDDSEAPSKKKK